MKFNCGPTPEEQREAHRVKFVAHVRRLEEWHDFFVIWPRRIGSHDCRFLETIQRRGALRAFGGFYYNGPTTRDADGKYLGLYAQTDDRFGIWKWEYRARV